MCQKKRVIGIFSRESTESYQWLITFLLHLYGVRDVRPVYITNYSETSIRGESGRCQFAILYHSKNRGRVNITDVTDSLYDEELKALYSRHGKKNVIVVIDDLEDSSEENKAQILQNQPSIKIWARDLFLFTVEEKNRLNEGPSYQNANYSASRQLMEIKQIINGGFSFSDSRENYKWLYILVGVILVILLLFGIIFGITHS